MVSTSIVPGRLPDFGEAPFQAPSASSEAPFQAPSASSLLGVLHLRADAAGGKVPNVRVAPEDEDDFRHDPCQASEAGQYHAHPGSSHQHLANPAFAKSALNKLHEYCRGLQALATCEVLRAVGVWCVWGASTLGFAGCS